MAKPIRSNALRISVVAKTAQRRRLPIHSTLFAVHVKQGRPSLPGLSAASVWMASNAGTEVCRRRHDTGRFSALTDATVRAVSPSEIHGGYR